MTDSEKITVKSSFGEKIRVTVFGGSHEPEIGCVIEGLPRGVMNGIDMDRLNAFMQRRAPGRSRFATKRKEPDIPEVVSEDPLKIIIRNRDAHPADYSRTAGIPRPGHADYTAAVKYGGRVNMSGGGPFSGRMTAPLCIAGGIALQLLERQGIGVFGHISSVGAAHDNVPPEAYTGLPGTPFDYGAAARKDFPVFDDAAGEKMKDEISRAAADLDSVGGTVGVFVTGCPAGIGGPMYDGLESAMAPVLFGIPAVKGVEFGAGFRAASMRGSENNDPFTADGGRILTKTNNAGGILGGITDGMPVVFRVAFKPTPSIAREQESVDLASMEPAKLEIKGRHDPCIAVRAVPVCEAAAAITLLDVMAKEGRL
ncbi:MAG: chorismate synthase [Anaerovoracaceae bacterium]|jgi:chorismate synthase